jgi:ATP-dependent protease Clp ATPase subunit
MIGNSDTRSEAEILRCSFCLKTQEAVGWLLSTPSGHPAAYICDECVAVCVSMLKERGAMKCDKQRDERQYVM